MYTHVIAQEFMKYDVIKVIGFRLCCALEMKLFGQDMNRVYFICFQTNQNFGLFTAPTAD